MLESTTINLGAATLLYKLLDDMLYDNSVSPRVEREYTFNVKYKLQRNIILLEKDYLRYEEIRQNCVKKYGEEKEDSIVVTKENSEKFKEEMKEALKEIVVHKFVKFSPDELDEFKVPALSTYEMSLFMMALVDDKEFTEELTGEIAKSEEDTEQVVEEINLPKKD